MKSFFKMIYQILRQLDMIILYLFYCTHKKINKKQVLFLSCSRKSMTGNFYYISKELDSSYTQIVALSSHKYSKVQLAKFLVTSEFILLDDFYPMIYPIPLRKHTKLIQVWHAMGAFKTIGYARKNKYDPFSLTHRQYDATIVSSPFIVEDYAKAFRMNSQHVYPIGIPRTDIFFDENYKKSVKDRLYKQYPQLIDKKIIMFAPTFRGENIHNGYYDFDQIDLQRLETLGQDYLCIIKLHPFIQNKISFDSSFFLDLSQVREINDLLFITDVLITDYSSVIYEASLLNIKTIFYVYDLDEYISKRDFFYPFESYVFGPVVKNTNELLKAIQDNNNDSQNLDKFKEQFTISCDGHSSKRFVETLMEGE